MLKLVYTDEKGVYEKLKTEIATYICGTFEILRTENGKPYVDGDPVFFSVSHSENKAVIAVSDTPVGVDMEVLPRKIPQSVLSRFSDRERAEINGNERKFLENWTAKEAFVKMNGGKIFSLFRRLEYFGGRIYLDGNPQNCIIYAHQNDFSVVTTCAEDNGKACAD